MPQTRLTPADADFIMKLNEVGYSNSEVARKLGVTEGAIRYRLGRQALEDGRKAKPSVLDGYRGVIEVWIKSRASGEPKARPLTERRTSRPSSALRAKTKPEAERVGKSMLRPILALDRLTFLEPEGKVRYRYGEKGAEQETMDYLEFLARVTSHIPDKGQVMVRYFGLYANAHRGKVKKERQSPTALRIVEEELRRLPSKP
jgi:hypothetical protein